MDSALPLNSKNTGNCDGADLLKFIMSLFVVATHTQLLPAYIYPWVRLAVPIFFVFSGYFFFTKLSLIDSEEEKKRAVFHRVKHIVFLYLFWLIVLFPLVLHIRGYVALGFSRGILEFLRDLLFSSTFQGSWFLSALIWSTIIVCFLGRKCSNRFLFLLGFILYMLACLSSNYEFLLPQQGGAVTVMHFLVRLFGLPCRNFSAGVIFIVIGKIMTERANSMKTRNTKVILFSAVLSLLLLFAEHGLLSRFTEVHNNDSYVMLIPAAALLSALALGSHWHSRFSVTLRSVSTIIYCVHVPVFMAVSKAMTWLGLPDRENVLLFTLTVAVSVAAALILLRLEKHKPFSFLRYSH
ncbi:MAG: acyltransferase [Oscillospiraceae bacterium]|nr:acyltransferase [Oscillospiraceae bacterium]